MYIYMEIDLTLKNEDIIMPSNLTIKRWDWTIMDLKCNTCCNLMIHLYCDNDEYDENNSTMERQDKRGEKIK